MRNNSTHEMFPEATAEEQAQQNFIKSLRVFSTGNFHAANKSLLNEKVLPRFREQNGSLDIGRRDVRKALDVEPEHQWWSSMMRTTQEMLYDTVGPSIARQLDDLCERASSLRNQRGSLTLNPDLDAPRYATALDYHCKPGNYHTELRADDVYAGAEFDRTFRLFSMGGLGPDLDDVGHTLIAWLKSNYADFEPSRILDMGCTVGHSTGAYSHHYPQAELHAIDHAAPCLRYGHARAVAMGNSIHFSQRLAEDTGFEDESFDLVVSHLLLHETTRKAIREIFRESYRLLRPGGVMVHMDDISPDDIYGKYYKEWMAHYNNEPYMGTVQDEDFVEICVQAGFEPGRVLMSPAEPQYRPRDGDAKIASCYLAVSARK